MNVADTLTQNLGEILDLHREAWEHSQARLEAAQTMRVDNPSPENWEKWHKASEEERVARVNLADIDFYISKITISILETEEYLENVVYKTRS